MLLPDQGIYCLKAWCGLWDVTLHISDPSVSQTVPVPTSLLVWSMRHSSAGKGTACAFKLPRKVKLTQIKWCKFFHSLFFMALRDTSNFCLFFQTYLKPWCISLSPEKCILPPQGNTFRVHGEGFFSSLVQVLFPCVDWFVLPHQTAIQ